MARSLQGKYKYIASSLTVEFIVPDDRERYRRPTHVAELRIGELLTIPLVEGVLTLSPFPLSYFFHLAGRHYLLDLPRYERALSLSFALYGAISLVLSINRRSPEYPNAMADANQFEMLLQEFSIYHRMLPSVRWHQQSNSAYVATPSSRIEDLSDKRQSSGSSYHKQCPKILARYWKRLEQRLERA